MDFKKSKILLDYILGRMRDAPRSLPYSRMYKLDGKIPLPCDWHEYYEWKASLEENVVHVAEDRIGEARVSTVFLGIDHNHSGKGPPVLFETMVFGGPLSDYQNRYCTWKEAEEGHKKMCALARSADKGVN